MQEDGKANKSIEGSNSERLVDFAQGKLSPEESLKVVEEVEKSEELSKTLELIIDVMNALHRIENQKTGFKQSEFDKAGRD